MNILEWFKNLFTSLVKKFKEFISKALSIISQELIAELKDFAIKAVGDIDVEDITNEEKRKAVFDKIKAEAVSSGKDLKDSLINTLIELALQYIKNN